MGLLIFFVKLHLNWVSFCSLSDRNIAFWYFPYLFDILCKFLYKPITINIFINALIQNLKSKNIPEGKTKFNKLLFYFQYFIKF